MKRMMVVVSMMIMLATFVCPGQATEPVRILAFGDSLTAGLGLDAKDAFPAQLQEALAAKGYKVEIINAGVSGDTSTAALDRLDWALGENIQAVIVELGANDALRGIDPAQTRTALDTILGRIAARKLPVLLAGMMAPRNLGPVYIQKFDGIYADLAKKHQMALYPFFLEAVAGQPDLNQADQIHPNAAGVKIIVQKMLPSVEALIAETGSRR